MKFDLGRASLASRADTSVAHGAVSSFAVCGDAVVAGARPAELRVPRPPSPVGPAAPVACCELALLRLLPHSHLPPALHQPRVLMEEHNWQGEAPWSQSLVTPARRLPFQWKRLEEGRAAGQHTFNQFPFLTTD